MIPASSKVIPFLGCLAAIATGSGKPAVVGNAWAQAAGDRPTPVLVELFTSEGCSSCPPADRFLERLDKDQPVPGIEAIVMSEHVDYWNHDGWVDPFSSAEFTQRQNAYDLRFKVPQIYTPQMVVDGIHQCVGSEEAEAEELIRKAAEQPKLVTRLYGGERAGVVSIEVEGGAARAHRADVYAALAENDAQSDVLAGENRGMKLHHVAIVRKLRKLGKLDKNGGFRGELSVASFAGGRAIVFVQDPGTGQVIGATMYRIPK